MINLPGAWDIYENMNNYEEIKDNLLLKIFDEEKIFDLKSDENNKNSYCINLKNNLINKKGNENMDDELEFKEYKIEIINGNKSIRNYYSNKNSKLKDSVLLKN